MNFWMIFLCLLFGAVIGYEFGRWTVTKNLKAVLNSMADELKKTVEEARKREKEQEKPHVSPLAALGIIGFNTKYYKMKDGNEIPEGFDRKKEMDDISNLIATMTYKGALDSEIGRAVRYSMVIVNAEKERLDWKQARKDEGIDILQNKYMKEIRCNGEGN